MNAGRQYLIAGDANAANKETNQSPDSDEENYADMPGTKVDSKQRITVRNLRIREDIAKYLRNLDLNSAYNPKTRSMRDNPHKTSGRAPEELQYAGESFVRFTGDKQRYHRYKCLHGRRTRKGWTSTCKLSPLVEILSSMSVLVHHRFRIVIHFTVTKTVCVRVGSLNSRIRQSDLMIFQEDLLFAKVLEAFYIRILKPTINLNMGIDLRVQFTPFSSLLIQEQATGRQYLIAGDANATNKETNQSADSDEEKYADMLGIKVDSKQQITVRNLRIREDIAKYLRNLDPNSAYYDPKTRSMRDNPYKTSGKAPEELQYAGDNFVRFTGDTTKITQMQMFAWQVYEKGVDIHLQACGDLVIHVCACPSSIQDIVIHFTVTKTMCV